MSWFVRLQATPRLAAVLLGGGVGLGALGLATFQSAFECNPYCSLRSGPVSALGIVFYSTGAVLAACAFVVLGRTRWNSAEKVADWVLAAVSLFIFLAVFLYVNVTAV